MSPLVWDVIVLNLYALASATYLYILMLPELTGRLGWLAIKVDNLQEFSERWAKRLAPVALLFAIGIHVVTAWIFSTQGARDWWFSPAMAPDFVSVAIAVGTTVVLLAAALAYGTGDRYQEAYRILGLIVFMSICVHLFLMMNDLVIHAWYGNAETERIIEIACDESGFSGGNLVGGGHSPVFAHASVRIESETARELVQHLRREIGARGDGEYKSPEILRPRRRPLVLWLLGSSSPIHGNAHVHLADTRFFVLAAWSTCSSAGRRCAVSPAQDRTLTPDRWRSPSTGRVRKAMELLGGRSSSLCRPIPSGPTTGGCRRRPSRCSTRPSRR
jgi:hypothetical protein